MNILRWKRKSKKKIKFKTIMLFIFSLIMTTFAWFAYSKILNTSLNIHIASWDMEYYINSELQENPQDGIEIPISTLYPAMPEQNVTVDIKNNGERLVDIECHVQSLTIAGIPFEIVQEGKTPLTDNYIIITPSTYEIDTGTGKEIAKGAITNDLTKLPFSILVEHSSQIEAASEGYLTVTVNWVGELNDLDSEWGYIVGDYFTNNPDATSAMTISLRMDSYQADTEVVPIVTTMPATEETKPYLPEGFSRVPGTSLESGLVIKDSSGNEFVWVEVPKNSTVYGADGLGITAFSDADYATIEAKLKAYAGTTIDDRYISETVSGLPNEAAYTTLKRKMLKSIYKYGGFYVGRYETGVDYNDAKGFRVVYVPSIVPTQKPVIRANAYPFNYIDSYQAQQLASSVSTGSYTTSLMFGVQWDLVTKYLETKGAATSDELRVDSTTWGNYKNNEFDIINANSKYLLTGDTWLEPAYSKNDKTSAMLTTGGTQLLSRQNIYNFAGNLSEWTLSFRSNGAGGYNGGNGGDFITEGTCSANYRAEYNAERGEKHIGFRVAMYAENAQTGPVQLPDTAETKPYLPRGFTYDGTTSLATGLTIKDASGNEYVWVEVPKNEDVYGEGFDFDIDSFTEEELLRLGVYTSIENYLRAYAADYSEHNAYHDTWNEGCGIATEEEYNKLKNKMLRSIYQNGGFYVGKYEAGIVSNPRNYTIVDNSSFDIERPITEAAVVQPNAYSYNWVRTSQAQELSSRLYSGEYTSSLMFGIQWDLMLKHIEVQAVKNGIEKNVIKSILTEDSKDYGNYLDSTFTITNENAKYAVANPITMAISEYVSAVGYSKSANEIVGLTTGASDLFSFFGIYDICGNTEEITLESESVNNITRGGNCTATGNDRPANKHAYVYGEFSSPGVGFRPTIF